MVYYVIVVALMAFSLWQIGQNKHFRYVIDTTYSNVFGGGMIYAVSRTIIAYLLIKQDRYFSYHCVIIWQVILILIRISCRAFHSRDNDI